MTEIFPLFLCALERRKGLSTEESTECLRLINSDADGFPGLTVDRFGPALLVEQHASNAPGLDDLKQALVQHFGTDMPMFFKARWSENAEERGGYQWSGVPHPGQIVVSERGLLFSVRLLDEEHVGLFLDSRPARAFVEQISAGKRVLNLFSYTGGFGMAAARGGAKSTVNIDSKQSASAHARRNYERNKLDFDSRTFFKCDVLYYLKRTAESRGRFDLIILDPPPRFSRRHQRDFQADKDYGMLLRKTALVGAPGALILAGLNATRVDDEQFESLFTETSDGPVFRVIERLAPGIDFPPSRDRPEGRFVL